LHKVGLKKLNKTKQMSIYVELFTKTLEGAIRNARTSEGRNKRAFSLSNAFPKETEAHKK